MSLPLETRKCLHDVLQAASDVESYTSGLGHDEYVQDGRTQAAVERKFEIIGEALSRLVRMESPALDRIPGYQRIISFRNVIAHGYDAIDHEIVWDVVTNHLPALRAEVEKLLGS